MMTEAKKEKNVIRATGVGILVFTTTIKITSDLAWNILINYQVPGMAEQLEKIQSELSLCEKGEVVFCNKLFYLYFAH